MQLERSLIEMCLPYRRIEDINDKLTKREIGLLIQMIEIDIKSSNYLKNVSNDFIPDGWMETREIIIHKLKLMGV